MKRFRFALIALVAACSDATTSPITQLNLDRPVDVAFACHGGLRLTDGTLTTSAQPIESCNVRSGPRTTGEPLPVPPGQEEMGTSKPGPAFWYAFILQSAPGTVAIARFETKPSASFSGSDVVVLDSDPLTPGKNSISIGEDPIAIATDKVGCYAVVANGGSCDLSTIEVNSAVESVTGEVDPIVRRTEVKNAAGEIIRARPAAIAFEPAGGVIGAACPATPTGLMYIAYPSCHLVAGVDVSTGTIVTGVQFDANGVPTVVNGNVSCPAECDGAAVTPGVRPVALDLELDTRTGGVVLAIGTDNSGLAVPNTSVLTAYALDNQTFFPQSLITIPPLEKTRDRLAVTSVAITPVIGMGGTTGYDNGIVDEFAPGGDHQFIYAVANDGSVRVVDISGAPRECDTQVDPRYLENVRDVSTLSCFTVGAQTTPPRRPGARGPGIELIGDAIPTSVDVARVDRDPTLDEKRPGGPTYMVGYFGMISGSNGRVYLFNVDDDAFADFVSGTNDAAALASPIPLDIAHQLRDATPNRGMLAEADDDGETETPAVFICDDPGPDPDVQGGMQGGPRLASSIARSLPAGVIAAEKTGGLPSIRQVLCVDGRADNEEFPDRPVSELFFSAPVDIRREVFPDLRALRQDEVWSLTYEGSLSNDKPDTAIDGPAVRMSQLFVDGSGMRLADATRPFCDAGVEPFDIVQLRGCDPSIGDAGCPIGYTCFVHPQSQVASLGACMLADEAERLSTTCQAFLTSQRRYTVGRTKSGELQLLPRKVALRTTPLDGCDSDVECEALADYAAQNASALNPVDADQPTDPKTWRCQVDNDRRPMAAGATGKRCLMVCNQDADCATGTVCQSNPNAGAGAVGYCMEGVVPPQACVNAPQRYELRAGDAFAVLGARQGYIHPIIADSTDMCVRDPNANPMQVGRIPLDPLPCDPTADPLTGRRMDGTFEPNPCKVTVKETEFQLNYVEGTCTLAEDDESVVTRDATGLKFRNRGMTLTLVDPTYQGDLRCHGDRGGMLQNVPLVMPGFQLSFRQTAGFSALQLAGIQPAFPVKVLRGPTQSMWIVDEGDFLSSSISQASTRGKVFRVEGRAINTINLLE